MHFERSEKFLEQAIAGLLERPNRALEALEKVRANKPYDLVLAPFSSGSIDSSGPM